MPRHGRIRQKFYRLRFSKYMQIKKEESFVRESAMLSTLKPPVAVKPPNFI